MDKGDIENKTISRSVIHLNRCLNLMKDTNKYKPVIPNRDTKLTGFIGQLISNLDKLPRTVFLVENESI